MNAKSIRWCALLRLPAHLCNSHICDFVHILGGVLVRVEAKCEKLKVCLYIAGHLTGCR